MFYGKLPVMMLSEMVSSRSDSTNGQIAAYILEHLDEIRGDSIRDLAAKIYVSTSSISRFCRDLGLRDYMDLRELLATTQLRFEIESGARDPEQRKLDYLAAVQSSLERAGRSLSAGQLEQLARDIASCRKLALFGMLKAETVAMNLQSDLAMLGKSATTKVRFADQARYLAEAGPEDLIIIFSYTGIYYDYGLPTRQEERRAKRPKLYFITSDPKARDNPFYDEVIWFDSAQDQVSHPFQLQLIGSLIAQSYAHLLDEDKRPGP